MAGAAVTALESARLLLDPVGDGDVDLLVDWWNDATVRAMHGLGLDPLTADLVRRWLRAPDRGHAWVARERRLGTAVGVIEMSPCPPADAVAPGDVAYELGVALDAAQRGRGYGREMVERLCAWAFDEAGAAAVTLQVMTHNAAALRTFDRAGFVALARSDGTVLRMQRVRHPAHAPTNNP